MSAAAVLGLSEKESARSAEGLWSHARVTPARDDRSFDVSKGRVSVRDFLSTAAFIVGLALAAMSLLNRIDNAQQIDAQKLDAQRQLFEQRIHDLEERLNDKIQNTNLRLYDLKGEMEKEMRRR